MRIYVGNIPYTTTEDELRAVFEPYGAVTKVFLVMDRELNRPRGFAFVEMPDERQAEHAIDQLTGAALGGRALVVNRAKDRGDRPDRRDSADW